MCLRCYLLVVECLFFCWIHAIYSQFFLINKQLSTTNKVTNDQIGVLGLESESTTHGSSSNI